MFCVASLVPSPPVLVPRLGGAAGTAAEGEVAALRAAVRRAATELAEAADQWIVVGAADADRVLGPETVGTFRGYGVDVRAGFTETPLDDNSAIADPTLPLPALIGAWLREQVAPHAVAQARLVAADTPAAECVAFGSCLRGSLDAGPARYGVLVVGDGAATLTTASPGYFDERAADVQAEIDRALSAGDRRALAELDPGLCAELHIGGRAAYQILAGLFQPEAADPKVETLYSAAPFGVSYHVSVWHPEGSA
ncbi:hypothetical protein ACWDOP_08365 [Nocardia sp. NPDC003693]